MNIAGIVKCSTVDFPEKLSCVLFTPGCNYDCWFCHNRELIGSPPLIDYGQIYNFLKKRAGLLEGVVISGGEPTIQAGLADFLSQLKTLGYALKLDTNGSNPNVLSELIEKRLIDYAAVDLKAPFDKYQKICGRDADSVKLSAEILFKSGIEWEMRTTVIPGLCESDFWDMAQALPPLPRYFLQRYRHVPKSPAPPHSPALNPLDIAALVSALQPNVRVR